MCTCAHTESRCCAAALQMRVPVGCSVAEIRAAVSPTLSERGLKVTTVHLDHSQAAGNRVPALVRLQPPTLPWKRPKGAAVAEADGGASASATSVAERALRALSEAKVALRGERAILQAGYRQCAPPSAALTWPPFVDASCNQAVERHCGIVEPAANSICAPRSPSLQGRYRCSLGSAASARCF